MSIQRDGGPLAVDGNDKQFDYRNKTFAVVIRDDGGWPVVLGAVRSPTGVWTTDEVLYEDWMNTSVTPESDIAKHGSAAGFVRNVLVPAINAWLARLFPPTTGEQQAGTALEQIDFAIFGTLKFMPQADGTLKVTA